MRALIIGGGICGPVTAMAMQQAGIEATVYEGRAQDEGRPGAYLSVASNGLDALRAIGAHHLVAANGFLTAETIMMNGAGKTLGRVPIGSARDPELITRTVKRADLQGVLSAEAVRRGVRVEFGKRLVHVTTIGGGLCAEFADGSIAFGDLLIGCDGIHSRTRTLIDPEAPTPRYVGLLNFGGHALGRSIGEAGRWHMIFGSRAFFGYAPDPAGGTVWFANIPRAAVTRIERDQTSDAEWKRWLIEWFARDAGPAAELIAAGDLQLAADNTHDLANVPVWHRASMAIVGDAAHAPSPSSGQGASMAIEDGVVLAKCLRDIPGIGNAFNAFDRIRRKRVERIVAQGARSSSTKAAGPVGRIIRDQLLPFVFRHVVTEQSMAWMYEHHVDWHERVALDERVA
jgi:2-polyprenyl-6-methoxyphenol hydroxylase-like FAD-dependent oxidoreductase